MPALTTLELIRRVPLFATLTPAQAEALLPTARQYRCRRGEVIVEQGQISDRLAIVICGRARVFTADARGREVVLAQVHPGDCIGEMSLIDRQPHSATVCAEVPTDLLIIGQAGFARCLAENNVLAYSLMRGLVDRLRDADRKIESLALLDVYGRVVRALLDMARQDAAGRLIIRERVSRQGLARVIGASREMVSRVMKDLQRRGLIEVDAQGRTVVHEHVRAPG
ncbi:MAG: Crp/Fnr family transcriptional regulator [Hydrogenophaga sp.]